MSKRLFIAAAGGVGLDRYGIHAAISGCGVAGGCGRCGVRHTATPHACGMGDGTGRLLKAVRPTRRQTSRCMVSGEKAGRQTVLTRPTYSSINFGLVPAAVTRVGFSIKV